MTVTCYRSTDTSAPTLSGTAGDLTRLLDAILVNGYGSQPSQGCSIAYTGTNKRDYKWGAGNQRYLDVDDTGTGGAVNYARVVAYETMTALQTGTNPFPSAAQISGGGFLHKSSAVSSVTRPWFAYGNGTIFYLFVDTASSGTNPTMGVLIFGDINSYVASDVYGTVIICGTTAVITVTASQNQQLCVTKAITNAINTVGHYICRARTGLSTAIAINKVSNGSLLGILSSSSNPFPIGSTIDVANAQCANVNMAAPNSADGGIYQERVWIIESSTIVRGDLPGMYAPLQVLMAAHLDTFSGTGALAGKSFDCLKFAAGTPSGMVYMENSNTW